MLYSIRMSLVTVSDQYQPLTEFATSLFALAFQMLAKVTVKVILSNASASYAAAAKKNRM